MDDDTRPFRTLSEHQCRDLLQSHAIGRIAWQTADGLQVLPVTYVCQGDDMVFRTSPYGVLSELIRSTDVALQVDELDEHLRTGWSVLVQGRAEAVAEPTELVQLWAVDGMVPWAPGVRNIFIRVVPHRITGRSLSRTPATDQWSRVSS